MSEVRTAAFDGNEMDYITFGRGEKNFVILPGLSVHSVTGLGDAVSSAYSSFCDEYTVYLFDRTRHIRKGYTVDDMAEDTFSAMKSIGITEADVFGVSQGGMIAILLAADHPTLVRKLIVGSTAAKPNRTSESVLSIWLGKAEKRDEEGLLSSFADTVYSKKTLSLYRKSIISSNRGITEEEWKRFIILASAISCDLTSSLRKIKCPVLVIGSDGDRVLTPEASREIASALGSELYMYPSAFGHAVYDEATDYKERCLEFLRRE